MAVEPTVLPYQGSDHYRPFRASPWSAGLDLRAKVGTGLLRLEPGSLTKIQTGVRVAIPKHCVGLIRGRSGLAFRHSVFVFEGTIDADYRGEISVLMVNMGQDLHLIADGDRIAQLVVLPYVHLDPVETDLDFTERGEKGFGSSGKQ